MAEQAHNATRNTPQHNEQQKNNASGRQSQQRKTAARHYATQHRGTTPRNDTRHNATGATRRMPRLWSDRCTSEYPKEVLPIYHVYETTAIVIYQTLHTSVDRLQQTEHLKYAAIVTTTQNMLTLMTPLVQRYGARV